MKTQITNLLNILSNSEVKDMALAVKETLEFGNKKQQGSFSSAELWNIQRNRRSFGSRRGFAY